MNRTQPIVNFLLAVLLLSSLYTAITFRLGNRWSDFPSIYASAKMILSGKAASIYDLPVQRAEAAKYFPEHQSGAADGPYALITTVPLGLLPPAPAKLVFDGTMIVLLATAAVALSEALVLPPRQSLLLIGLMAISGPTFWILTVSKSVPIALCAISLTVSGFRGKRLCVSKESGGGQIFSKNSDLGKTADLTHDKTADESSDGIRGGQIFSKKSDLRKTCGPYTGFWFGLCLVRPQEALPFLVFALGARKYRFIAEAAVVGLGLVLLSFPAFGISGYSAWLDLLSRAGYDPAFASAEVMPTLKGQLLHLHLSPDRATSFANTAYLGVLGLLFLLGSRRRSSSTWWRSGIITAFSLGLAFAAYMHVYDAILLMPVFCLLLMAPSPRAARALVILSLLAFLMPLSQAIHEQSMNMESAVNLHFAAITLLGLVALYSELTANNHDLAALSGD